MRLTQLVTLFAILSSSSTFARCQEASGPKPSREEHLPSGAVHVLHDQPDADKARYTLWVRYPGPNGQLLDHAQYLEDLHSRLRERGLAVAVILPKADAQQLANKEPRFVVAAATEAHQLASERGIAVVLTKETSGPAIVRTYDLDLIADIVQQCLDDRFDNAGYEQASRVLQTLLQNVADAGDYGDMVQSSLKAWPRSGRSRACAVLFHWWCEGDLEAASKAVDQGIQALSNEAAPMTHFADLVLRGDRNDRKIARKIAMAMAPVAAGASDGVFTQLVYLRALLRAGQDRLAGRLAATMPKRLAGMGREQICFAETLMEADNPLVFRDLAMRAAQNGDANGAGRQWSYAARHKILKRCGEHDKAAKLVTEYRIKNGSSNLNNEAWYLIVRPDTMGRFDTMALAQCEEMQRIEGDGIDYGSLDTVALAHFVNGKIDEAIELQTTAAQGSNNDPVYLARLTRYKNTR